MSVKINALLIVYEAIIAEYDGNKTMCSYILFKPQFNKEFEPEHSLKHEVRKQLKIQRILRKKKILLQSEMWFSQKEKGS